MSFDRKGEDVFITGTVSSAGFYGSFVGDGSGLTNLPGGTASGGTASVGLLDTAVISGYRVLSNTQKAYRLLVPINTFSPGTTIGINGEAIYAAKFFCQPGQVIDEIAMRIMTAGAAGLGLAQVRFLIYRAQLDANGEIVGGALELDTNININTLSPGLKVVSGLNHTLSSNTYKDVWFMAIRNYQTGSLSVRGISTSAGTTYYGEISQSTGTVNRDMTWYWNCLWNSPTPASMPTVSGTVFSTTSVTELNSYIMIGYSAT